MYTPNPVCWHYEEFRAIMPIMPEGPIGEFGVFQGGATVQLASFGRQVYAFDTFEGMPTNTPYDETIDNSNPPGKFIPEPTVVESLETYPNIKCVKGIFQETLPVFDPSVRFAFAYLDCDWYSSYQCVVRWLSDRMRPGAVGLVDDYIMCDGCRKAIDEMVSEGLIEYQNPIIKWLH